MISPNGNGTSNWRLDKSESFCGEEGVYLNELAQGDELDFETAHHHYHLVKRNGAHVQLSGHPMYCPQPVDVEFEGSFANVWPSMPKPGFIGRGMHLMFKHPEFDLVATSEIREIHKPH
jgi:hypothetical protein